MSKQRSTLLPKRQQYRTRFSLKFHPFDKVERSFDIVAQNGNIVEATGNKVACCFDIVASVDRALQSVQNAAARLVTGARRCDDMTPILRQLYWLPVRMAVLVFQCLVGQSPSYVGRRLSSRLRRPSVPFPVIRFIDVRRSTHTQRLRLSVFCCSRAAGFELLAC